MKLKFLFLFSVIFVSSLYSQVTQKREFRGVWVHVVGDTRYNNMSTYQQIEFLTDLLNKLQEMNFNAVIFQVRPAADALYPSTLEPWSRYLTGKQGVAPEPYFDPMLFMIEECHKRNMEFHAWVNPYRVTLGNNDVLDKSHIYHKYPDRFIKYGDKIFFDPGIPQNREFICDVVRDIVKRYDVDAIHIDDYFYPYPVDGLKFNDNDSFNRYAERQGFSANQLHDWRRDNVNLLIEKMNKTIKSEKPWVRFGVSPFGIYRNKKDTPDDSGSNTKGLQGHSDLFADVKLWVEKGWVDYNIPQVYWEIGHSAADYETLVKWWSRNNSWEHLYIGQDVARTIKASDAQYSNGNQLTRKMELERKTPAVYGNCFFHAYDLIKNLGGVADSLKNNYQRYPALIPAYLHLHNKSPKDVKSLKAEWTADGYKLKWKRNGNVGKPETAQKFVIYRFQKNEKVNLEDASKIIRITGNTEYLLPYKTGQQEYIYVVTTVDRFHNESPKGKTKKVKL